MSDLKKGIQHLPSPDKEIGNILMEFYETMKRLESDPERGGKQATKILGTLDDLLKLIAPPPMDLEDEYLKHLKKTGELISFDDYVLEKR